MAITNAIVNMVVKDCLPFNIVEGEGFQALMRAAAPLYKVPCRNTVKNNVDQLYDRRFLEFKTKIKLVEHFSVTTDIWTDTQTRSMLGITLHGVDVGTCNLFSVTLGVVELTERHTAEYISDVLLDTLRTFEVDPEKVVVAVTDNGANMVKAIAMAFGKQRHVPCFAHTLNLVCEVALADPLVTKIVEKCRAIVVYGKRHVRFCDELRRLQKQDGVKEGDILKLLLDVKTRWNSTFYMLERLLKMFHLVGQILLTLPDSPAMLTNLEKEEIQEIISLLRPLEAITKQVSGEKYGTLSSVIPLAQCGVQQVNAITTKHSGSGKLKKGLQDELQKRFGRVEEMVTVAVSTILDPRFKTVDFENPVAISNAMKKIRTEMNVEKENDSEESSSSQDDSTGGFDLWSHRKSRVNDHLVKKRRKLSTQQVQQDELSFYLNAKLSDMKENPLQVWEDSKSIYPSLHLVARKYAHLVATSVPAERLFSKAGNLATVKRNRLTCGRLSKLLFLSSNYNF